MTETTEGERARALGEPRIHDLDFLTRLIHDADRAETLEGLLDEIRTEIRLRHSDNANLTHFAARIDQVMEGRN